MSLCHVVRQGHAQVRLFQGSAVSPTNEPLLAYDADLFTVGSGDLRFVFWFNSLTAQAFPYAPRLLLQYPQPFETRVDPSGSQLGFECHRS